MPHVTVEYGSGDNPVYQVGRKSFIFFRNPRPDAFDPDTGERYADVIVFWVESEADKQALVQDEKSPFFTTAHFNGHPSVLLRASRVGELTRDELAELIQDAWLSRASARRRAAWLNAHPPVQAHITTFWTTIAADYEAHAGNVAEYGSAEYQRWVDTLASVLPDPPADVLDVATGTGYLALAAASLGHRVTAVDLAPAMLDELVASATARRLVVDARLGDAVAPDFPPASFDAVTSRHLLWTLREPATAMANWRRLLRPGGRLVAVDGFWFTEWDDTDVPPVFAEHYTADVRGELPLMHLDGPEPILDLLAAAGFVDPAAEPRPDLSLGGGVPYLITATNP
jgi:SAM-dependent methyltransferase